MNKLLQRFFKAFRFILFGLVLWAVIALGSCAPARTLLQQADLTPARIAPQELDNPAASFEALRAALYGPFISPTTFALASEETLANDWLDSTASVERRVYSVSHGQTAQPLEVIIVRPNAQPDAPIILSQNFSSNRSVIADDKLSPLPGKAPNFGPLEPVFTYFFGRHIVEPPLAEIIGRGYAFVAFHPPDYLADNAKRGTAQLDDIFADSGNRPGALNVWASLSTALAKNLKAEAPNRPIIAYGHSRYGKTALLAGAYSDSIDVVIAHQSGTAGASLMRDGTGETIADIVRSYPHWLTPGATDFADNARALPTDAHALLAALDGKPVLLGNARRDVWSDPVGAYRAAKWASQSTDQSFNATRLDDFRPGDDIAIWTRPGTHGVVKEDWPAFLDFLDAHLK